jgi:ribonucleoside-diphosphate reductase alpha chain
MKFVRRFTTDHPIVDQIEWKTVEVRIAGKEAQVPTVEVPAGWSENAANILADKYLRKAGVPRGGLNGVEDSMPSWLWRREADPSIPTGPETSAKQVFHRMVGHWAYVGWKEDYFRQRDDHGNAEEQARAFYDELYWMLAHQYAAPNSPQWFNTGLWWAYGITGNDSGMWRVSKNHKVTDDGKPLANRVLNSYEHPQPHACFLTPVIDDLVNEGGIMDAWVREARIFKHGSGSGINPSVWRAKGERLSGGGVASGVMSWLKIGDAAAGAIQSGGTTRRAAKLVCLDDDHPELIEFIRWKVREEGKAAAMDVGSQLLRDYHTRDNLTITVPQPMVDRLENGFEPEALPATWESENMRSIDGQNSNNSVRVTDSFMEFSVTEGIWWPLKARTTGETMKVVCASDVWDEITRAAWACADPGLIFHDTVNAWNTCAADGAIRTSNPCCEFHHLDGSACNLASLRLTAFLLPDGAIDIPAYEHAVRLWSIVLDISVSMASFPAKEFAVGAYLYRTFGLGYADLGGLLMRLALPYNSDEGRALAAALTALMTGVAYRTSAELAAELGPFPRWGVNQVPFRAVMQKHRAAVQNIPCMNQCGAIVVRAQAHWDWVQMGAKSFRNAQTTLIAPTGTISFVMDCDTTGVEPDYALVKTKQLAGGGTMKIINQAIEPALKRLGYNEDQRRGILLRVRDHGDLKGLENTSLSIFACVADLEPMAHVWMVAAIQPFLSGAASKTVNLPNDATIEDVSHVYREAHRLGLKAVALYRDGSKLTQPLAAASSKRQVDLEVNTTSGIVTAGPRTTGLKLGITGAVRGEREPLPTRRRGETQKARVSGQTVYWRTGEYPDGRLGELFIDLAGAGSALDGFANCLAKMTSIALQFGAPVGEVVDAFLEVRFEPSGHVELHDRVKWAGSIPALIARDLAIAYQGREDLANVVRAVVALDKRAMAIAAGKPTGEICQRCGGSVVQTGTCRTCVECGESLGGCG